MSTFHYFTLFFVRYRGFTVLQRLDFNTHPDMTRVISDSDINGNSCYPVELTQHLMVTLYFLIFLSGAPFSLERLKNHIIHSL